jgi:hypothetical protein
VTRGAVVPVQKVAPLPTKTSSVFKTLAMASDFSSGPAAVLGSRSSPLPLAGGRGDSPVYWQAGGGDLHIYVAGHICTVHRALGRFLFFSVLQLLIWWRGQWTLFLGKRNLRRCLLQPSTIHLGTTAWSSPYGLGHCCSTGERA